MNEDAPEPGWMAALREWSANNPPMKLSGNPLPPWEKFPHIPRASIGWRIGPGEDYRFGFAEWFASQSPDEQAAYVTRNPEPPEWSGFFAALMTG